MAKRTGTMPRNGGSAAGVPCRVFTATVLTDRFDRALLYAAHVHGGQVRKETTIPYIAHLLAVAATVLEYGGSEDMAIGGLLHDAVEDLVEPLPFRPIRRPIRAPYCLPTPSRSCTHQG